MCYVHGAAVVFWLWWLSFCVGMMMIVVVNCLDDKKCAVMVMVVALILQYVSAVWRHTKAITVLGVLYDVCTHTSRHTMQTTAVHI